MPLSNAQRNLIESVAKKDAKRARYWAKAAIEKQKRTPWHERVLKELSDDAFCELPPNLQGKVSIRRPNEFNPNRHWLSDTERSVICTIERNVKTSERLTELGINRINATLLYGEPGTGKTTLAHRVAYNLNLPLMYVNFSHVIDSHMGTTALNLARVIDYAESDECVLMLDELDCIASTRVGGSDGASREMSNITSCLIQRLDRFPSSNVLIATTNRLDIIDPAIVRRFATKQEITAYDYYNRRAMVVEFLNDVRVHATCDDIDDLATPMRTQSDLYNALVDYVVEHIETVVYNH